MNGALGVLSVVSASAAGLALVVALGTNEIIYWGASLTLSLWSIILAMGVGK